MRIVFAGTPEFAAQQLDHLLGALAGEIDIVAAYTQPDRRAGRGKKLLETPVKQVALANGIDVYQPISLRDENAQRELRDLQPDLMIVAAYGLLLPKAVLEIPKYGCINIHASLLPRWRGAAPIERCILAGDEETGVTIMQMDEGLDTGDMLLKASCAVGEGETGDSLRIKLAALGKQLIVDTIKGLQHQTLTAEPQDDSQSNYAAKLEKGEGQLDWSDTAEHNARKVRAFTSAQPCFVFYDQQRLKITAATPLLEPEAITLAENAIAGEVIRVNKESLWVACVTKETKDTSVLSVTRMQLPGKKELSVTDLLNGKSNLFIVGDHFT